MKKWINEKGFLDKNYSLDKVREQYRNRLEQERNKLLKNFQEGVDYTTSYEDDGKKTVYILNSPRAKETYFGGSIIEGMEYRLEESEEGFSAQITSPVFRPNRNSKFVNRTKIELIDEGKSAKDETSTSQLNDEIEDKKRKLDEEAKLAQEKAKEYERQAEEARRKKAELENFTPHQEFHSKK